MSTCVKGNRKEGRAEALSSRNGGYYTKGGHGMSEVVKRTVAKEEKERARWAHRRIVRKNKENMGKRRVEEYQQHIDHAMPEILSMRSA